MFVYDYFGIKNADFYNINLDVDNRKFLDPYVIELLLKNCIAIDAAETAVDFFETIRQLLKSNNDLKAYAIFGPYLSEPHETCMGYSTNDVNGKGIKSLGNYIIDNLKLGNMKLLNAIISIVDVKLFMNNISNDRVSGFIQHTDATDGNRILLG